MIDPVTTSDGYTYERNNIEKHMIERSTAGLTITSPHTGQEIGTTLIPNRSLQQQIRDYWQKQRDFHTSMLQEMDDAQRRAVERRSSPSKRKRTAEPASRDPVVRHGTAGSKAIDDFDGFGSKALDPPGFETDDETGDAESLSDAPAPVARQTARQAADQAVPKRLQPWGITGTAKHQRSGLEAVSPCQI